MARQSVTSSSSLKSRQRMLANEMRSIRNHGFHNGYDEGQASVVQESFDTGYEKSFEQNFILSTLKGVAEALVGSNRYSISDQHISMLKSMKFDNAGDIESIKKDLINICRRNRLEILAHYVSQVG